MEDKKEKLEGLLIALDNLKETMTRAIDELGSRVEDALKEVNEEPKKSRLIPFDIEKAKQGAKVVTRNNSLRSNDSGGMRMKTAAYIGIILVMLSIISIITGVITQQYELFGSISLVCTYAGLFGCVIAWIFRTVRILCYDLMSEEPIAAIVLQPDEDEEKVVSYTNDGKYYHDGETSSSENGKKSGEKKNNL